MGNRRDTVHLLTAALCSVQTAQNGGKCVNAQEVKIGIFIGLLNDEIIVKLKNIARVPPEEFCKINLSSPNSCHFHILLLQGTLAVWTL